MTTDENGRFEFEGKVLWSERFVVIGEDSDEVRTPCGDDHEAATRHAIFWAAVAIGKQMRGKKDE